jgi:hypothetical protein
MVSIYASLDAWRASLATRLRREKGAETIEWIALAAVILVLLLSIMAVFSEQGRAVGEAIIAKLLEWIGRWG